VESSWAVLILRPE